MSAPDWQTAARRAWSDHQAAEREALEQRAAGTREYLLRQAERLHLRPSSGTARLGEESHVRTTDGYVAYRLYEDPESRYRDTWELRCAITDGVRPDVVAWVLPQGEAKWIDRGTVETQADLGRALDPAQRPETPCIPEREQTTGDMLETILRAIVTEVVHDVIDGTLGRGSP